MSYRRTLGGLRCSRLCIAHRVPPSLVFAASPARFKSTSSTTSAAERPQRALLYVPGSDPKKLKRSLDSSADALIYDLEDSVASHQKGAARSAVFDALQASNKGKGRLFVRINSGEMGGDDLEVVLKSPHLEGIVIPKVDTAEHVRFVDRCIEQHGLPETKDTLAIIASVESPLSLINLREIATSSKRLSSLLFAAEDYCASSNILRTPSRLEMLLARQTIVAHARAFGLKSIDMVCVAYKDRETLKAEAQEGREMGFDGKQAIHPAVDDIQATFVPTEKEIKRAIAILEQYEVSSKKGHGAYGLQDESGGASMIDAPVLLQANAILAQARAAGLEVSGLHTASK